MSYIVNALSEIDHNFIKCVSCLFTTDSLTKNDASYLQMYLEEAIKTKTGVNKDLTGIILSSIKQPRIEEFKSIIYDESKGSNSDNELELDLLKDDLMCIVCHEMDIGARNRLLECSGCHALYHQECHRPPVTSQEPDDTWVCQKCKDASKKAKLNVISNSNILHTCNASSGCIGNSCVKCPIKPLTITTHRHSSSSSSTSSIPYKISSTPNSSKVSEKYMKLGPSLAGKSGSLPVIKPTSSSSLNIQRSTVTPIINIISADKRLQIMKKKAAKLQEKRKQLSRN